MNIKSFLRACRDEQGEINILLRKREQLYSSLLPAGIRYDGDRVQTTPEDRMLERMPEIAELDKKISQQIRKLARRKAKAMGMINKLQDSKQRQVLTLYYLDNRRLSWEKVAAEMGYSRERVLDFVEEGLKILIQNQRRCRREILKSMR